MISTQITKNQGYYTYFKFYKLYIYIKTTNFVNLAEKKNSRGLIGPFDSYTWLPHYFRENIVSLDIGFKSLTYEMEEQQPAYDQNSLFGKIFFFDIFYILYRC